MVSGRFQAFCDLERDDASVAVAGDGVRAVWLGSLDGGCVGRDHLVHGTEEGLAWLETASTEGVEGALVLEVFCEVDEDEDFSHAGVDEEDGGFVTGELERDDGIVFLLTCVLGDQSVDVVGETGEDGVLEDLDDWNLGNVESGLCLSLEPIFKRERRW